MQYSILVFAFETTSCKLYNGKMRLHCLALFSICTIEIVDIESVLLSSVKILSPQNGGL